MIKSQEDFGVSFLDVEMKELSGIDVAKHIRKEQEKKISAKTKQKKLSVIIKCNEMQKKVLLKDIFYIESCNKKVVFYTNDGKIDTYGRMEDWESELGDSFYRCHRGYLVNLEKITAYNVDTNIINGDSLILTQKKYSDFIKAYMRYAKDGGIVNV